MRILLIVFLALALAGCYRVRPVSKAMSSPAERAGVPLLRYTHSIRDVNGNILFHPPDVSRHPGAIFFPSDAPTLDVDILPIEQKHERVLAPGEGPAHYLYSAQANGTLLLDGKMLILLENETNRYRAIAIEGLEFVGPFCNLGSDRLLVSGWTGSDNYVAVVSVPDWRVERRFRMNCIQGLGATGIDASPDGTKLLIQSRGYGEYGIDTLAMVFDIPKDDNPAKAIWSEPASRAAFLGNDVIVYHQHHYRPWVFSHHLVYQEITRPMRGWLQSASPDNSMVLVHDEDEDDSYLWRMSSDGKSIERTATGLSSASMVGWALDNSAVAVSEWVWDGFLMTAWLDYDATAIYDIPSDTTCLVYHKETNKDDNNYMRYRVFPGELLHGVFFRPPVTTTRESAVAQAN